jgi:hypothetical protein
MTHLNVYWNSTKFSERKTTVLHNRQEFYLFESLMFSSKQNFQKYEGVSKSFRTESITKYMLTTINTRWEATKRFMAAKLTRLTHKIVIQLHLVADSCTICSSRSRRLVLKLLDTPSYLMTTKEFRYFTLVAKERRHLRHGLTWQLIRCSSNSPLSWNQNGAFFLMWLICCDCVEHCPVFLPVFVRVWNLECISKQNVEENNWT